MLTPEQLRRYLNRIGFDGQPRADRETLATIARFHTAAIPFENLDPLMGKPAELAVGALVAKLVQGRRGGFCFEQNGLLWHALETIGFDVTALAGRVRWNIPAHVPMPRTHNLLLVRLGREQLLIDVGFGGAVLSGILELREGEQATPHEPFRLLRDGDGWAQQISVGGEWRTTYGFDLQPQLHVDFGVASWWASTNPASPFTHGVMAALALPDRRLALRDADLAIHHLGGPTERRRIGTIDELIRLLAEDFGIGIVDEAALRARLEAVELLAK